MSGNGDTLLESYVSSALLSGCLFVQDNPDWNTRLFELTTTSVFWPMYFVKRLFSIFQ